jgi:hypothetical protein
LSLSLELALALTCYIKQLRGHFMFQVSWRDTLCNCNCCNDFHESDIESNNKFPGSC